jgi:hypothetical protein
MEEDEEVPGHADNRTKANVAGVGIPNVSPLGELWLIK